jgi:hypothetical protein
MKHIKGDSNSVSTSLSSMTALSVRLRATGRRLGEGGASNNVRAGDKCSNLHNCFRGTNAPLAPNRSLSAGILPRVLSVSLHCRLVLHCRYGTQFHYFVGLQFVVGTILNSTTLSGYTTLSVRYSIPLLCRLALHCRYGTQFHYFVGTTTLSGCTLLSFQFKFVFAIKAIIFFLKKRSKNSTER